MLMKLLGQTCLDNILIFLRIHGKQNPYRRLDKLSQQYKLK